MSAVAYGVILVLVTHRDLQGLAIPADAKMSLLSTDVSSDYGVPETTYHSVLNTDANVEIRTNARNASRGPSISSMN